MILSPSFFHEGPAAFNPQQDKLFDQTDCEQPHSTMPHETPLLLPRHLMIKTSICQLPSRIMPISKQAILHPDYEKLKDDEKLSVLVVVCDADSQILQAVPLCVDLYEAGMKTRSSTCYLSVNISTNFQSTTASRKLVNHPIFHIQRNACLEPGQIALQFSFSQPDTLYTIRFSLHSTIDSEGIQVIGYSSESNTFNIHTANCLPLYQDAAPVLGSGLPLKEFSGPLKGSKFDQITNALSKKGLSGNIHAVMHLTKMLQKSQCTPCDIKVLALIYTASYIQAQDRSEMLLSKKLFKKALTLLNHSDCQNSSLLEGMAHTFMAQGLRVEDHFEAALSLLDRAKVAYFGAAPSSLTSSVYFQEAMICAGQCKGVMTADVKEKVEELLTLAILCSQRSEGCDYEKRIIIYLTSKAMLHLGLFYPLHQHRQEQVSLTDPKPSSEELHRAKACLDAIHEEILNNDYIITYKAIYYFTLSEYYRFCDKYPQAIHNLQLAKKHAITGNYNILLKSIDVRLALLGLEDTPENIIQSFL